MRNLVSLLYEGLVIQATLVHCYLEAVDSPPFDFLTAATVNRARNETSQQLNTFFPAILFLDAALT